MKDRQKLNQRQELALDIIAEHGPIEAADLAYHLPGEASLSAARSMLNRLKARGLIDKTFVNAPRHGGASYIVTDAGERYGRNGLVRP